MQLKAVKLAALLSRLRLAPLALLAGIYLATSALPAVADQWFRLTITHRGIDNNAMLTGQLQLGEIGFFAADGTEESIGLTSDTASSPTASTPGTFFYKKGSTIGTSTYAVKLFSGSLTSDGDRWNEDGFGSNYGTDNHEIPADKQPVFTMHLSSAAKTVVGYNLRSGTDIATYTGRAPWGWILEGRDSSDGAWKVLDTKTPSNTDGNIARTTNKTWYCGGENGKDTPSTFYQLSSAPYTPITYIDAPTRGPALRITGFHLQLYDRVETKVQFNDVATTGSGASNHTIFCNRDEGAANSFSAFLILNKFRYDRSKAGTEAKTGTEVTSGKDYVIEAEGNTLTAKGNGGSITVENTIDNPGPSSDLLLYGHNNSVSGGNVPLGPTVDAASLARMKMYYFKVYDSSGNIRLDLIPAKNSAGVAGLYDCVSGNFYSSVTGVEFTPSTDVVDPSTLPFLKQLALDPRRVATNADERTTGGDIILKDGDDYIHIFSTVGSQTFTVNNACYATALLVGGGGGGGANDGGGGGAGGMVEMPSMDLSPYLGQGVTVTVGAGAAKVTDPGHGKNGSPSSIEGFATAYGGGGGGYWNDKAGNGGEGCGSGGGSCGGNATGTAGTPGVSTTTYAEVKQGNDGGKGSEIGHGPAGGGGGAGSAAAAVTHNQYGGNGGVGRVCSILGGDFATQCFAGGGGGGSVESGDYHSSGGSGGGGDGASSSSSAAKSGEDGLGGGGGGGIGGATRDANRGDGAAGGSGIVIIRVSERAAIPDVSTLTVTLSGASATYTGSSVEPNITITDAGGTTLFSAVKASAVTGRGFTAQWKKGGTDASVQNAGTYTLTLTGDGATYTGTADQGTFTVNKKMAATPVAVVTTYTGSTQDAPIKDASGNSLAGQWKLKSMGQSAGSATGDVTNWVTVELRDTNNYTYADGATTAGYYWTITHVRCACSTYSTWTPGENNILLGLVPTVTGCGVGNESTAGVAVLTDGANPITPTNDERCELKGNGPTTLTWDLGGMATVSELRVFIGVGATSWGHANVNITKLEYYDATAGEWKELKFFAQTMPYYVNNTKQVKAVIARDTGSALFENATQLRLTMYAPITISESAYYSSLTEIEAIGEVHASPIPEANLPRLEPQRTFKYDNTGKTVSLSDDTYVQIVSGDGTGTATATAAGVYHVWVQPKPGYVWPDDESSAPRKYEWGIVPSGYTEPFGADRSFLKTLENSPYRVAASALPPDISGGDIFLRFPNPDGQSYDFVHVYTNTAASGFVFENNSGMARQGRALLVGGGGASGYTKNQTGTRKGHITGGGGGGGGVRSLHNLQFNGVYSIWVGHGGIPAGREVQGTNGEATRLQSGSVTYAVAGGGGGGKSSTTAGDSVSNGLPGGSGGGGAGMNGTGGSGDGDGYGGGEAVSFSTWTDSFVGAGGGGAGRCGFNGRGEGESGGYGYFTDILASPGEVSQYICLGGGGAGGGDGESAHGRTLGGIGGGGNSYVNTTDSNNQTGVNGLGGGASACSMSAAGSFSGTGSALRGGDGIVIIRYTDTVQASKIKTVEVPEVPSFVYNHELQDTGIRDTEDYTVSDDVAGVYIQEYTITLTLRDPDNMQWSDGTTQPKHIKWYIRTDYNVKLGSFYYGLSTNHTRVASDPANLNADFIFRQRVGEEYRYVNIFTNNHASVTIPSMTADILLIGGGGGGGAGLQQAGGGGGGAGGVVLKESQTLSGEYSITIGAGGSRGSSGSAGGNGGETYLSLGGSQVSGLIAHGGGGGAGGNESALNGKDGASGGGAAGVAGVTTMTAGQCKWPGEGHDGGLFQSGAHDPYGGGGGGAGAPGGRGVGGSGQKNGGNGVSLPILGYNEYFGGGGAGQGGVFDYEQVKGGLGGGGNGVWRNANPEVGDGMDGQGGGGGSSGYNSQVPQSVNGGRGGCGLVVIVYSRAAGLEIDKPVLTKGTHTFTGSAIDVTDSLTSKDHLVFNGTWSATNVGTYTFTAQPEDGYCWTGTVIGESGSQTPIAFEWSIAAKPIQGNITVPAIPAQTYTGSPITPSFTVRDTARNVVLTLGTDYTAEYVGNVNIGTATIKLTGTGNYTGVETATFQIVADPNVTGYYVTADADGSGDGTGWASPFTLQQAFNAIAANAAVGTTNAIYMKVGTYKNTTGPWTATPNKRCFIHVLGGYLGVNLARSTTEYTVLDGEGERGLVSVTVNISQSSIDHGKWILFDQIKFYRGKRAYYINVVDGKGNYFSRFVNCRFIDNIAPAGDTNIRGSAIEVKGMSLVWVENCEFRGNKACTQYATTIFAAEPVSNWYYGLTLMNSLFVGNSSQVRPCVAHFGASENNNITIKSCTFAYNAVATEANRVGPNATGANGGLVLDQRDYNGSTYIWDMTDTIFYGNRCNGKTGTDYRVEKGSNVKGQPKPQYLLFEKATAYVEEETTSAYADVDPNARHYIFGDPLFVTPLPAAVEFDANYNPTWYADSAKTVTVSPADMDVHLQSTKGRWNGSEWVIDANYSPAIDAGCPDSGFAEEPECNGGRINLGAYGNTSVASKSYEVPETDAATMSAATGYSEIKQLDNGHTVLIYSNVTDAASFTVAEGGVARILVVGGGGNGGSGGSGYGGGGGGAGGVVERSAVMLAAGTYTVVVGGSSQDSVLNDSSGTALITAYKGGNGGPGYTGSSEAAVGKDGGSGGGCGGYLYGSYGGKGTLGQGNDGGSGGGFIGFGGGGFSMPGSGVTGGNGYISDITGEMCGYACGGGGGAHENADAGKGGCVTIGGDRLKLGGDAGDGNSSGKPGVNGTGSGGGGTACGTGSGGRGGSGIVVVHLYTHWNASSVTFDDNGGSGGPGAMALAKGEALPTLTQRPTRTNFKFGGYARKWWEVTRLTGNETDILTEGTGKWAYCAWSSYTLNGVRFDRYLVAGETSMGNIEVDSAFDWSDNYAGDGTDDAGEGLNYITDPYCSLMRQKVRMNNDATSPKTLKLTIKNLTVGKSYLVQILYHGAGSTAARQKTLSVDNEHFYNCVKEGGGENSNRYGWSFVRRFAATDTSEDIHLYASAYLQVNAIQLRELTAEDLIYYDADGNPTKGAWDVDGDETLYAIWNRGTMYKLGVDGNNQSSWDGTVSAGSIGWSPSRDGTVVAHTVSADYDYVVVTNASLRTPYTTASLGSESNPTRFSGHSLTLEGSLQLRLGGSDTKGDPAWLQIDRLIGAGGTIYHYSAIKMTLLGESVTINDDSSLKISVDAHRTRHLYVKPPISGAGDLILELGKWNNVGDRYNTVLTLEGDNSGFTGAIKTIQPDDWAGLNPSQYDFYVMNNFGGTVESLPDLASCGVTNYVHFKYDGLVGDRGLRISTNEFSSVIRERIVLYSDETDFDAPNLPLMTFPEGTAVDPAAFTVRHAAGTNGTGTAFIRLKTITNGDGTITLVANGDMSSEPAHFQRVESIHSTGSQYLNTGYCPNAKTWMEADLFFVGDANPANDATASIFGTLGTNDTNMTDVRNTSTTYAGHFGGDKSNKNFIYESGAGSKSSAVIGTPFSNMWIVIEKTSATVAGVTLAGTCNHAGTAAFPLYLFGCNAGGTGYAFGKFPQMSVRSWKIYESDTGMKGGANERLVRDFVPVIDTFENNRPGLYDRVEGKFYPSETGVDFLTGEPTEPAAYFGGKAKASISDAEGYSQVLQVANDHTVLVFANTNAPGSFTVSEGGVARVLVIGGGGAGGDGDTSGSAGGGGAGAMIEEYDLSLAVGATYTVTVGAGGAGADTKGLPGNDGDDSSLKCGEESVIVAEGGGGGGGYMSGNAGHNGGSGGGSYNAQGGKATKQQYGHDGGMSIAGWCAGGGGGAGSPGQNAPDSTYWHKATKGGAGLANDITGSWVTYAAGGDGYGGEKGGADGTGSGGNGSMKSCAGGSGVVIVHLYTKWSVDTVTLDHNDGTGESDSVFVKAGAEMPTLITIPERHSYAFAGYFDAVTGGTQYYTAAGASARVWDKDGDATLYAHWEIDLPPEYDQLDCLDNGSDSSKAGFVCVDFQLQPDHVVRTKYEYNTDPTDTDFGTVFMSIAYYSEDGNLRYGLARQASAKAAFCYGVRTMSTGQGGYKELPGSASKGVHEVVCQMSGAQEISPTPGDSTGPTGGTIAKDALPNKFFIMAKPPESRVCDKSPYALDGTLNGCGLIKMYYLTVTNASGAVLLDLVPAKRTSDNAEGLYDLVGGKFYPLRKPCGAASPADPNRCAAHEVGEWHDQSATDDACGWHCGMCTNCMRVIRQMIPAIQARRSWPWDGENHRPTIDGANGQCKLTGCGLTYGPSGDWIGVGDYTVTLTPAAGHTWTDGTATNVIYNYAITEPEFHVMRADGPLIDVKKAAWLDLVYGNDKTHEYYQAALFETNRQGVVAWQAYVLGFEASKDAVDGAAIVEETVQNADPATVTIRLANMPPLREGTGCTVKYSLYAATSTEDLMNDRGTVVTNLAEEAYYKWPESTFEAPLDDLTENEPVRYYRIKVHFTFGGGSGGGEDEPKATVFYTYLDTVDPDALPSGWAKDSPGPGKDNEYYVRTGPIDIPAACLDDGYVRVSFKTTVKYNGGYFTLTFLDENGAELSNIDALKVAVDSLATAENGQLVTKVYRVPAGANVQKIHMQWADSNSARGKGDPQSFADVVVSNIKVESLNYLAAASEVDAIFGESVDSTAYATAKATYFDARSANADWTRGLQGLHDALVNGGDYNILVMGDSLAEAPFNGAVEALIKRQWPQSNVRVHVCWNGNSGCTQFAGSGYTQRQTDAENKYQTLLEHGFAGYNCVIFSGTSQARCASSWLGLSGAITTINNAIKEKNPNCSVVFLAPQLSVDTRYFKPWNTSEDAVNPGDGYWLTEDYYYPGYGQPCASRADWSLSTDKWAPIDYSKFGSEISTLAGGLGMAYWDLYEFAYDYLFRSGKPYFYYSRDAQHANEYNRVLSAKQLFEVFKLVAAKDFTTP